MSKPKSPQDVLRTVQSDFGRCVDATAIARDARRMGIIPERIENKILHAETKGDANDCLFKHLRSQATLADLRNLCSIIKEVEGYSQMIGFGETLQAELDKNLAKQEEVVTDRSLVQQPRCGAEEGASLLPAESTTLCKHEKEVQKVVAKGECDSLHSLAKRFRTTVGHIVRSLSQDNAEVILDALKSTALCSITQGGVPNAPSKADINNAHSVHQLFCLLHIHQNWVDISLLEELVDVSDSTNAAAVLAEYQKSHQSVISKALAHLVDPSTDGTCPRPDANSCILQLVFSDKREGMRVQEVLACKDFLKDWFGIQPESIKYTSAIPDNSLVVTWLVSRCTGLRIVNQCRSTPVLAALQKMEVLAVRLRYPGQLISVEVDVNLDTSKGRPHMEEAVRSGDLKRVKEFIQRGMDVNEGYMVDEPSHVHSSLLIVAIKEGHEDVALELLAAGADVHVKDRDGRTALHWACDKGLEEVVKALIGSGSRVNEQDMFGLTPVMLAADWGNTAISMHLVRAGASCGGLSEDHVSLLFHRACHEAQGDLAAVRTLLKGGCNAGSLSKEEQEELLLHACHEGDMLVVEALIAHGCIVSCVSFDGYTPLMAAAQEGHEEVVKKLILAGANFGMQDELGNTALHYAALHNHTLCGIHLAEGGASVTVKNKFAKTPLDLAKADFNKAIMQALSFTTRKIISIIGNTAGGKSTLIASLQAESNSRLGKVYNWLRRVDDTRKQTAGIETVPYHSQRYGEVLFFDFAGQHKYHGPHQMLLESLLSKAGVSMTLLLVVNATEEEEAILHQLHNWLSPVALMATPASPQVIVIGSFLDKVKSKQEATAKLARCIEATRKDLEELPLEFVGSCLLNCRQPQSEGMDQLCSFLREIPIPDLSATHTQYSLAWALSQIRSSFKAQAVQLQELSAWIQDNKDSLPQTMPPPEVVCQDLSATGHALYLPNKEEPPKSWLVLDLSRILHDIYENLFSQSKEMVNEFGLLHHQRLTRLFPDLDLEVVQQLLISLEFCIPVDPSLLKVEVSELIWSEEAKGWLFFPALISAKPPQPTSDGLPQQTFRYLCWQLKTSKKHSISAHVIQAILLHLVAHFVMKLHNEMGIQQHCCSIWQNGIAWQSKRGTDTSVHINNRVIQVISANVASAEKSCQYLIDVISDILTTIHRLTPKLAAGAYIVHPPKMTTLAEDITAPNELFPVEGIQSSITYFKAYTLSLKDSNNYCFSRVAVSDLFGGFTPSLEDIRRINWPQPEPNQTQSPAGPNQPEPSQPQLSAERSQPQLSAQPRQPDVLSQTVNTCERYIILFRKYVSRTSAGKGRAVLEGIGLPQEVIQICYYNHPMNEEEFVQDGLKKWAEGYSYPPTWNRLLDAMEYAGVGQQHQEGLRKELCQNLIGAHRYAPFHNSAATLEALRRLLVRRIASHWREVALHLGVEFSVINMLQLNHQSQLHACTELFEHWLSWQPGMGDSPRTWQTVLLALEDARLNDAAHQLSTELEYLYPD